MIKSELTNAIIESWGSFTLSIDQTAVTVDMSKQSNQDFFLRRLLKSRIETEEIKLFDSIKDLSFFDEIPAELLRLADEYTEATKERGKYQVKIKYSAGNVFLEEKLTKIKALQFFDIDKVTSLIDEESKMPSSIVYILKPTQQQ